MKKILTVLKLQSLCLSLLAGIGLMLSGCTYPKINQFDPVTARARFSEPILLIPPLNPNVEMVKPMKILGQFYLSAINNRINNQLTYAGNIESLEKTIMPENMIINGMVNIKEAAGIARTLGCNSVITIRVHEFKQYPPFRIVLEMQWIDAQTGNNLSRLYQIVDMTDAETDYRFSSYVGDGPARYAYEQFAYYKGLSETASLQPAVFLNFTAFYSTKILFDQIEDSTFSWRFWYLL